MTIQIIQRAKFALLYHAPKRAVIEERQYGPDSAAIVRQTEEAPINCPAIISLGGLRLTSETPTTAAKAAEINEAIEALHDMTLSAMAGDE
jgi:Tfp pilus assembly pilus retraction ATPase PilT